MLRKNFIVLLLLLVATKVYSIHTSENEVSFKEMVQKVLNISPPDQPVGEFDEDQQPPKHMLELYHRFTAGRRASGETVRSITPNIETASMDSIQSHSSNALTFTISHISDDEEVRLAQLVLRRRRVSRHPHPLHRKLLPPPFRVRVFEIVDGKGEGRVRSVPLASIPVPQVTRGGWHSLDITSAVRELLLSSSNPSNDYTLGVRFEAPRSKIISPSHFLDQRDNTSVFLMLFTEESKENDVKNRNEKRARISEEDIVIIEQHISPKADKNIKKGEKDNHVKQRHHSLHHIKNKEKENFYNNPRRHKNKNAKNYEVLSEKTDIEELINMNEIKKLKRHKKVSKDFNKKFEDESESEERIKIKSNLIDELLENSETKRVIRSSDQELKNNKKSLDNDKLSDEVSLEESDTPIRNKRTTDHEILDEKTAKSEGKNGKNHRRRSIYDNELPYEKLHIKSHSKTLTTTEQPEVVTDFTPEEEEDDKNLIPYPPGMEKKKKRKWRRGKKKNHRRTTKLPDEWNKGDWEHHHRLHTNISSSNQTCSRRNLVVNFKEFGWDWVIAPKLFNAHYCTGSCSIAMPESVPVTNHAIIQSLLHYRRLRKGVPAPCCVPHSMSPLTILYIQDNNHVILKNYRSMIVETCGCR